jgi:hypothetical protein
MRNLKPFQLKNEYYQRSIKLEPNKNITWELFRDYYYVLLDSLGQQTKMKRTNFKIKSKIFLLDATTISLCLSLFAWQNTKLKKVL